MPENFKYWCFISYRHMDNRTEDRKWASWLHQAIEQYQVPADLIGKTNAYGEEIPDKIYPVFRDEEELPASHNLEKEIRDALNESRTFVILCSPRSKTSPYVQQEIDYYRSLNRKDRMVPVAIASKWIEGEEHCLPSVLEEESVAIAADFRLPDGSEGYTSAEAFRLQLLKSGENKGKLKLHSNQYKKQLHEEKLKVLSNILGVEFHDLRKRDEVYQLRKARRQARGTLLWIAAASLLIITALVAAFFALEQRSLSRNEVAKAWNERATRLAVSGVDSYLGPNFMYNMSLEGLSQGSDSFFDAMLTATHGKTYTNPGGLNFVRNFASREPTGTADELYATIEENCYKTFLWRNRTSVHGGPMYGEFPSFIPFSTDGKVFATIRENVIKLWKTDTGEPIALLKLPNKNDIVSSVAFSPLADILVSFSRKRSNSLNKSIHFWDLDTGDIVRTLEANSSTNSLSISPSGKYLAAGSSENVVSLWQLEDRSDPTNYVKKEISLSGDREKSLAFSSDERYLAAGFVDENIRVWDIERETMIGPFPEESFVSYVAFQPNSHLLASHSFGGRISVWDVDNGELVKAWKAHDGSGAGLAFANDGKTLVSAGGEVIRLWDPINGSQQDEIEAKGYVQCIGFSPSKELLLARVNTIQDYKFRYWDGMNLHPVNRHTEESLARVGDVAFSPDNHTIASTNENHVLLWETLTGTVICKLPIQKANTVAFQPQTGLLCYGAANGFIAFWDVEAEIESFRLAEEEGSIRSVEFNSDGKLAFSSGQTHFKVWDTVSRNENFSVELARSCGAFAPHSDPPMVAVGGGGHPPVRIHEARTGEAKTVLYGLSAEPNTLAYSPDGRSLAAASHKELLLWDVESGKISLTFEAPIEQDRPTIDVQEIAFSQDGKWVFGRQSVDARITVWDASNGRVLRRLQGHDAEVAGMSVSPNGKLFATGGGSIFVWPLTTEGLDVERLFRNNWVTADDDGSLVWNEPEKNPSIRGWIVSHPDWVQALVPSP